MKISWKWMKFSQKWGRKFRRKYIEIRKKLESYVRSFSQISFYENFFRNLSFSWYVNQFYFVLADMLTNSIFSIVYMLINSICSSRYVELWPTNAIEDLQYCPVYTVQCVYHGICTFNVHFTAKNDPIDHSMQTPKDSLICSKA